MKHYVVLAYPKFSEKDYTWIQDIRRANDSLFDAVNPHFTLVFPLPEDKLAEEDLIRHIELKVRGLEPVQFTLTKATTEQNHFPAYSQTHLVASDGANEIARIHDLLYTGILASLLRNDIPYVPHVTIANQADQVNINTLTETLNRENITIKGIIDTVTFGLFDGKKVTTLKIFALQ